MQAKVKDQSCQFEGVSIVNILYPTANEEKNLKRATFYRFSGTVSWKPGMKGLSKQGEAIFAGMFAHDLEKERPFLTLSFQATYEAKYNSYKIDDKSVKIHRKPLTLRLLLKAICCCFDDVKNEDDAKWKLAEKLSELTPSTCSLSTASAAKKLRDEIESGELAIDMGLIWSHAYLTTAVLSAGYGKMDDLEHVAIVLFPELVFLRPDQKQLVYLKLRTSPEQFFFAATCPPGISPLKEADAAKLSKALNFSFDPKELAAFKVYEVLMKRMASNGSTMLRAEEIMSLASDVTSKEEGFTIIERLVQSGILYRETLAVPDNPHQVAEYYMDGLLRHQEDQLITRLQRLTKMRLQWLVPPPALTFLFHSKTLKQLLPDTLQRHVFFLMLSEGITAISGRGGNGKSFVTHLAIKVMQILCPEHKILLVSYTGRASVNLAQRYRELCEQPLVRKLCHELIEFIKAGLNLEDEKEQQEPCFLNLETNKSLAEMSSGGNLVNLRKRPREEGEDGDLSAGRSTDNASDSREAHAWMTAVHEAQAAFFSGRPTMMFPQISDKENPTREELRLVSKWTEYFNCETLRWDMAQTAKDLINSWKDEQGPLVKWYATHPHPTKKAKVDDTEKTAASAANVKKLQKMEAKRRKHQAHINAIGSAMQKAASGKLLTPIELVNPMDTVDDPSRGGGGGAAEAGETLQLDGTFQVLEENVFFSTLQNILHMHSHGMEQMAFASNLTTPIRLFIDEQLQDLSKSLELISIFPALASLSLIGDEKQLQPIGLGSLFHSLIAIRERDVVWPFERNPADSGVYRPDPAHFNSRVFGILKKNYRVDPASVQIRGFLDSILAGKWPEIEQGEKGAAVLYMDTRDMQDFEDAVRSCARRLKSVIDLTDFITHSKDMAERVNGIVKKIICPSLADTDAQVLAPKVCFVVLENFHSSGSFYATGSKWTVHSIYQMYSKQSKGKASTEYTATYVPTVEMDVTFGRETFFLVLTNGKVLPLKEVPLFKIAYGWAINAHRKQGDESLNIVMVLPLGPDADGNKKQAPIGAQMIYSMGSRSKKHLTVIGANYGTYHMKRGFVLGKQTRLVQKMDLAIHKDWGCYMMCLPEQ